MLKVRAGYLWLLGAALTLAVWRRKDIMTTLNMLKKLAHPTNFAKGRVAKIDTVVIHTTEGSFNSATNWFAMDHKPSGAGPSSAHYIIARDGRILVSVEEQNTAWHASDRGINNRSIGIELEGRAADPQNFTPEMMATLLTLSKALIQKYGIPVKRGVPGFIGHVDVKYARETQGKTDPGQYFPWDSFFAALNAPPPPQV